LIWIKERVPGDTRFHTLGLFSGAAFNR